MVKHFFQTQHFRDFDFHIPFAGHHGIPILHLAGHKFMSFEEDEVPGELFFGRWTWMGIFELFRQQISPIDFGSERQTVFSRGAVFFFG